MKTPFIASANAGKEIQAMPGPPGGEVLPHAKLPFLQDKDPV